MTAGSLSPSGGPREPVAAATAPAMRPLAAQLDVFGEAHELAPATERMRLFEPAPAQLAGQSFLDLDGGSGNPGDPSITQDNPER